MLQNLLQISVADKSDLSSVQISLMDFKPWVRGKGIQ